MVGHHLAFISCLTWEGSSAPSVCLCQAVVVPETIGPAVSFQKGDSFLKCPEQHEIASITVYEILRAQVASIGEGLLNHLGRLGVNVSFMTILALSLCLNHTDWSSSFILNNGFRPTCSDLLLTSHLAIPNAMILDLLLHSILKVSIELEVDFRLLCQSNHRCMVTGRYCGHRFKDRSRFT